MTREQLLQEAEIAFAEAVQQQAHTSDPDIFFKCINMLQVALGSLLRAKYLDHKLQDCTSTDLQKVCVDILVRGHKDRQLPAEIERHIVKLAIKIRELEYAAALSISALTLPDRLIEELLFVYSQIKNLTVPTHQELEKLKHGLTEAEGANGL